MSDELTREQLEKTLTIDSIMYRIPRPIREVVMVHDASLRSSRDAERERVESAKRRLQDMADELTAAEMRSVAHLKMATETGKQVTDLTTKLNAMTKERDEYKERAKWKHVHDDSLEIELQRKLAEAQATIGLLQVEQLRRQADCDEHCQDWTHAQLDANKFKAERDQLQATVAAFDAIAYDKDGTPFASASAWRKECNRLQATITAQQKEIGRLGDLQAIQDVRYNRVEYRRGRVTLLRMYHSMDAVIQMQKREIERMRGGSEPS